MVAELELDKIRQAASETHTRGDRMRAMKKRCSVTCSHCRNDSITREMLEDLAIAQRWLASLATQMRAQAALDGAMNPSGSGRPATPSEESVSCYKTFVGSIVETVSALGEYARHVTGNIEIRKRHEGEMSREDQAISLLMSLSDFDDDIPF